MVKSVRLVIAAACLLTVSPAWGQVVDWLYDVDVIIDDRSADARAAAASEALRRVLIRLTGLPELPPNPVVAQALRNPDRFYVRYGFAEETADGLPITKLRVRFAEASILRLLSESGLPLWSANRPVLMVWAVVDVLDDALTGSAGRTLEILSAGSTHPLAKALVDHARDRGLPLVLPTMDLEDQLAVPLDAVLGGVTLVLRDGAARYRADALLIARVTGGNDAPFDVRARTVVLEEDREFEGSLGSVELLASATLDPVVDVLTSRYAVVAGADGRLSFRIDGVSDVAQYAAVVRYLDDLEFIDSVSVDRVERHALHLTVGTRTPWAQLKDLFDLDGRLVAVTTTPFGVVEEIPLLWRGDAR